MSEATSTPAHNFSVVCEQSAFPTTVLFTELGNIVVITTNET